MLERTEGVVGFFGASSMERLPTEVAMTETMRRFKSHSDERSGPCRRLTPNSLPTQTFDWGSIKWLVSPDSEPRAPA